MPGHQKSSLLRAAILVRVKDEGDEVWKTGTVMQLSPVKVKIDGWPEDEAHSWDFVAPFGHHSVVGSGGMTLYSMSFVVQCYGSSLGTSNSKGSG